MTSETLEAITEVEVTDSESKPAISAEEALAGISPEPVKEKPGMAATMAFVNWMRKNEADGFGICGIAKDNSDEL